MVGDGRLLNSGEVMVGSETHFAGIGYFDKTKRKGIIHFLTHLFLSLDLRVPGGRTDLSIFPRPLE